MIEPVKQQEELTHSHLAHTTERGRRHYPMSHHFTSAGRRRRRVGRTAGAVVVGALSVIFLATIASCIKVPSTVVHQRQIQLSSSTTSRAKGIRGQAGNRRELQWGPPLPLGGVTDGGYQLQDVDSSSEDTLPVIGKGKGSVGGKGKGGDEGKGSVIPPPDYDDYYNSPGKGKGKGGSGMPPGAGKGSTPTDDYLTSSKSKGTGSYLPPGKGKGKGGVTPPGKGIPSPSDVYDYFPPGNGNGGGKGKGWMPPMTTDDDYHYKTGTDGGFSYSSCAVPYLGTGPIPEDMWLDQNGCLHMLPPAAPLPYSAGQVPLMPPVPTMQYYSVAPAQAPYDPPPWFAELGIEVVSSPSAMASPPETAPSLYVDPVVYLQQQTTISPSLEPSSVPNGEPTAGPSEEPISEPTSKPSAEPTIEPTGAPSLDSMVEPSSQPSFKQAENDTEVTGSDVDGRSGNSGISQPSSGKVATEKEGTGSDGADSPGSSGMSTQVVVLVASISVAVVVLTSFASVLFALRRRRREHNARAELTSAQLSNANAKARNENWPQDTRTVCSGGDDENLDLHLAHMTFDDLSLFDEAAQVD